jgi:hypothetical protein
MLSAIRLEANAAPDNQTQRASGARDGIVRGRPPECDMALAQGDPIPTVSESVETNMPPMGTLAASMERLVGLVSKSIPRPRRSLRCWR